MSTPTSDQSSQLQRALVSIRTLRERLEEAEGANRQPIAVVGMAGRFPGATSVDEYWDLIRTGGDAITEVPEDRWDAAGLYDTRSEQPGTVNTRWGGFLEGVDRFDAAFFGISPREATQMDPQQRMFLETAWEALEDAGQNPDRLAGSPTGVFVGVHTQTADYMLRQSSDRLALDVYSGTGTSHSATAGRLSYLLDLRGPSMAVDTACSSSLVAVHLGVRSLRSRESSVAIVGGVNLMLDPMFTMIASRMGMMSPTGRCRPFDAAGDGYVRSEACAALVLRRLDDALEAGDRIHAVIRGSAVNQDGRSNGLTAPNSGSQVAVARAALADARTDASAVRLVEAHGTGTPLGDPIEFEALSEVHSGADGVAYLGSAKANIGHTEGAAGVAGLIKSILSVKAATIPPLVHFSALNPHISTDGTRFAIPAEAKAWPADAAERVASVSSFGWAGTNAHVIIAEAPDAAEISADPLLPGPVVVATSARSEGAVEANVTSLARVIDQTSADALRATAAATLTRRASHSVRVAAVGSSAPEIAAALRTHTDGGGTNALRTGRAIDGLTTFICPGQGSQWEGMTQGLASDAAFQAAIDRCTAALRDHVPWSLREVLETGVSGDHTLGDVEVVQPALFAMSVGLAAAWEERGVTPDAVIGHSMGEVAAAHIAGILSLDDAAAVICARSRLLSRISGAGAMAVVDVGVETARELIAGDDRLAIGAVNGPRNTVLSGAVAAIEGLLAGLDESDVFHRRIAVDVASHSPQVDSLVGDLVEALADITPHRARIPFISTVTGGVEHGPDLGAAYWARNLREPVDLLAGINVLAGAGHRHFVELSPHPVLTVPVAGILEARDVAGSVIASLHRGRDGALSMAEAVAEHHVNGGAIDWERVHGVTSAVDLPTYAWQRDSFWFEPATSLPINAAANPLGESRPDPTGTRWQFTLDPRHSWCDHSADPAVRSAALIVTILAQAAADAGDAELHDVQLLDAIDLTASGVVGLVSRTERSTASARIELHVLDGDVAIVAATATAVPGAVPMTPSSAERAAALVGHLAATDGAVAIERIRAVDGGVGGLSLEGIEPPTSELTARPTDAWLASRTWQPFELPASVRPRRWLITGAAQDAQQIADALTSAGDSATAVTIDAVPLAVGGDADPTEIVMLVAPAAHGSPHERVERHIEQLLTLRDLAVAAQEAAEEVRIRIVTSGAHTVSGTDVEDPIAAAAGGFGRVIAEESPSCWAGLIDRAPGPLDVESAATLADLLRSTGTAEELAIREDGTYVARLAPSAFPDDTQTRLRPDETVLISGAFGAIGEHVVGWLADNGARRVILVARTDLPARAAWATASGEIARRVRIVTELERAGVEVHSAALDVADAAAVDAFSAAWASAGRPPVSTIIHAPAIFGGEQLADVTADSLRAQLHPKVTGALNLAAAFEGVERFVMFSSASGSLPMIGTAAYAAANAAIDAVAADRRERGAPAVAIAWGVWATEPSSARADGEPDYRGNAATLYAHYGLGTFRPAQGLAAFGRLLDRAPAHVLVAPFDWQRFGVALGSRPLPLVELLLDAHQEPTSHTTDVAAELAELAVDLRADRAEVLVRELVASVLRLPADRIDPTAAFGTLGLDSMMGVQFRNLLEATFNVSLSATVAWNHPTSLELAQHLLDRLDLREQRTQTSAPKQPAGAVTEPAHDVAALSEEDALAALMQPEDGRQ